MPIKEKPKAIDFYNSVPDKDGYYWRNSGVHTYNVLAKEEKKELEQKKLSQLKKRKRR